MSPPILTRASRLLGIRYPIVQGGLARVARAELCAAVSAAGGLGQIATAGLEGPEALRAEIAKVRAATDAPFGVNFPLGRTDITAMLEAALEEGVPVIALTAGNPAPWIRRIDGRAKVLVLIAGPELARKAEAAGADLVATVGYEGGGHLGLGDETTMVMVPRVVRAVSIPVLASGGIADGAGLLAALALGAEGVEMGTRFVASREARAHDAYKQALVAARPEDTAIIKRSLRQPGRVLRSAYTEALTAREAAGAPPEELVPLVAGEVNEIGVGEGRLAESYVWAGQAVGLIEELLPAGEIVARMAREAHAGLARLRAMFQPTA
ncbi:MAG: NAD(P)H-dependent flavin oxidoreductase [Roseococcus sp.]